MANITEATLQVFQQRYLLSETVEQLSVGQNDGKKRQTLINLVSSIRKMCRLYGADFMSTIQEEDGVLAKIDQSRIRGDVDAGEQQEDTFATETVKKRFVAIMRFVEVMFVETNDEQNWQTYNAQLPLHDAKTLLEDRWKTLRQAIRQEEEARDMLLAQGENNIALKQSEARVFVKDWQHLVQAHAQYLAETADIPALYHHLPDQLELAQNRFITLLYIAYGPGRLEYMKIVAKLPQNDVERDQMDAQNLNYIFFTTARNGRRTYHLRINDHKTAGSHHKYECTLNAQQAAVYRALLPLAEQANLHYLFATNSKTAPFGFTLRLQEAFEQAIGVPLSVDVLRKMFIYRTLHNRPLNRSRANEVTKKMRTNIDTITRYYVFDVPDDHQDPQIIINGPLPVRRGQRNTQTDEEKEALLLTQGTLWDIPGNIGKAANPWNLLKNSQHVITINGRRKKVATILQNRSVNTIAAMARAIKKKQNN